MKYVFKELSVRIPVDKAGFPSICPICGRDARMPATANIRSGMYWYLRPLWRASVLARTNALYHNDFTDIAFCLHNVWSSFKGEIAMTYSLKPIQIMQKKGVGLFAIDHNIILSSHYTNHHANLQHCVLDILLDLNEHKDRNL